MAINTRSNQLQKSTFGLEDTQSSACSLPPPRCMAYNFLMLTKEIFSFPQGLSKREIRQDQEISMCGSCL